jgi:hypothetical protein
MIEKRRFVFVILGIVAALSLLVSPVAARATVTEFTGTQWLLEDTPGAMTFPGGNIHVRGAVHVNYWSASDPRLQGTATIVAHGNMDANMVGPFWGPWRLDPDVGEGYWEGTYTGYWRADGSLPIHALAHGRGAFEGLKVMCTIDQVWPPTQANPGIITGRILDPHGG